MRSLLSYGFGGHELSQQNRPSIHPKSSNWSLHYKLSSSSCTVTYWGHVWGRETPSHTYTNYTTYS